jgi:ribosome-binding protein aMBF1 (putative translation factor)
MIPLPETAAVVVALAGVAAGANQIMALADRLKEKPPPAATYVTKETCATQRAGHTGRIARLEQTVADVQDRIREDRAALDKADEDRASRIHRRIDDLERDIHDRIQALPNEIVALLRNTGNLR